MENNAVETKKKRLAAIKDNKTFDTRRARLAKWMGDRHLSQTEIAARTGKTRSYVSLLLKAGKAFGEKTARYFEVALHMPDLWLEGDVKDAPKSQAFSELANLLEQHFDALDMDAAEKQSAFVAASQTLITFAARKKLLSSSAPAHAESPATPSNEAQKQPSVGSSQQP